MKFSVRAIHEIEATYEVEAGSHDEAVEKLCSSEPIAEYTQGIFGPDEHGLADQGIKVLNIWCNGPGPGGPQYTRRSWEVEEVCDGG